MKYFISHSYRDRKWAKELLPLLRSVDLSLSSDRDIFFSSKAETGSDVHKSLLPNIDQSMNACEILLLVVTENYLRSYYCFYELNLAGYLKRQGKKALLLVQSAEIYQRIKPLFPDDLYINAADAGATDTLLRALGISNTADEARDTAKRFFDAMKQPVLPLGTPYVGMSENIYKNTVAFSEGCGVERMTFGYPATQEVVEARLQDAREIIFVSTTGCGFLKTYRKRLAEAVALGADLSVVVADRDSDFCIDVGDIEVFDENNADELVERNRQRLASEFDSSVQYLNEIYKDAVQQSKGSVGSVQCCCGYTLIRQTSFVVRYDDRSVWGWITCTMPPERAADHTPSTIVNGSLDSDPFARVIWKYCKTLTELATHRGGYQRIDGATAPRPFCGNGQPDPSHMLAEAKHYWLDKQQAARNTMDSRGEVFDAVLIEVAAQHPLFRRREPNTEFRQRLDKAIKLYNELTAKGLDVSIYVPGSRHKYNGIADDISLSEAGCRYLRDKGIPDTALIGDDANQRYKGEDGVYNSADECYVASRIFLEGDYGKLVCICSPNQIMRKTMLYLEFGCLPTCYGVTTEKLFHADIVKEIFDSLNIVLYEDHSWQDSSTELYSYFRQERKP